MKNYVGSGISKKLLNWSSEKGDYILVLLKKKIISHADNLIIGIEEVDIEFIVNKWKNYQINNLEESIDRLKKFMKN